jgi:chorismate dehydratase
MADEIDLVLDYPSKIANYLVEDKIDIGLVPVVTITRLKEHHIISDYCIACDGEVASVALFSEVPIENVTTILLDYQSRTSVALLKILLQEHWKINPQLLDTKEDFTDEIIENTAGLIIGDRAIRQRSESKFIYDLGLHWKLYTGLPFVFAAWISNKPMTLSFIEKFNAANGVGLNDFESVVAGISNPGVDGFDIHEYFTSHIKYDFSEQKRKGMELFLSTINLSKTKNV